MERRFRGILGGEQLVQNSSQAVDIGARGGLRFTVLLRSGVPQRAEGDGIFGLAWFEMTRDAEVDQVQLALKRAHDVSRLQITKNDWRLMRVQVIQHTTQLYANSEYFAERTIFV